MKLYAGSAVMLNGMCVQPVLWAGLAESDSHALGMLVKAGVDRFPDHVVARTSVMQIADHAILTAAASLGAGE
jgi:hypothetical protein